jgi:hypothetical protein
MINQKYISKNIIFRLLQLAAISVFLGRAWQHLVWDAPFRTLLWDEGWMKGIVGSVFKTPWEQYITSPETDTTIQSLISGFGWFYLLCALMVVMIKPWRKVAVWFMYLGSISLIVLALLYCKERFFSAGQFLEYSLQFSSPLFLYSYVRQRTVSNQLIFLMKVTVAFTFVCHGLYAIGYYPRPGYFIEMTMLTLGLSETSAIQMLKLAGILDFVIGIGIFLPARYAKWIILYAVFWGLLTTLARVVAYVDFAYFLESSKQWVHESVYRLPHFIVPLILYLIIWKESNHPDDVRQAITSRGSTEVLP